MSQKPMILVLCTGNSCRSQMAEAFLRMAGSDVIQVASAGSAPSGYVHPLAVRTMAEVGIDLTNARSKSLDEFLDHDVETVITVCENADRACPKFPGQKNRYHWGFRDPALAEGTEEQQLEVFRRIRDEISMVFTAYGRNRVEGAGTTSPTQPGSG